jgi:hypothetical protein
LPIFFIYFGMIAIDHHLLIGAILILASIAIAKLSDRIGIPTLVLFLGIWKERQVHRSWRRNGIAGR